MKYLDLSGLGEVWANIKSYISSKIPTKTSQLQNDSNYATTSQLPSKTSQLTNDSDFTTNAKLATKQDTISDLAAIRSGASKGATAVQPSTLSHYLPFLDGYLAGNITVNSTSGGWVNGFDWYYNNVRYAYIHPLIDEANGMKLLTLQADSGIKINSYTFLINLVCHDLDNFCDLGTPQNRFKDVYATNATINTSDRNAKTDIKIIDDNLLDAWDKVSLVLFKFKDAVEKKGDNARLHCGYIAQDIQEELNKHGIDACKYGLFCYNAWDAQEEKSHEEKRTNADGTIETVKVIDTPAREAGETFGLRYIECLVVECAYLRKKNKELESRITKLEKNLNS